MKPDFDYNLIPHNFGHCLNAQCARANECLRHQAALRMPPKRMYVTVLNPAQIPPAAGKDCPHFKADQPLLYARGMDHLLDHIPHNDAVIIKQQMLNHFDRNYFYRLWRKERLFTPNQQEYVRKLFLQRGIQEAPVFDEYLEQYEW